MKTLWRDPDYRAKISVALSGAEEARTNARGTSTSSADHIREEPCYVGRTKRSKQRSLKLSRALMASKEVRSKISVTSRRNWQGGIRPLVPVVRDDHFSTMAAVLWADPRTRELHREKIAGQWEDQAFRDAQRAGVQRSNAHIESNNYRR